MKLFDRPAVALRLAPLAAPVILTTVWGFHAVMLRRWLSANVLPNGYQNEIFHLGNALDLWVAWQQRAWPLLHDLLFTQYWPPLHYLSAFPLLSLGISRDLFVLANLGFLALLLASTYALGRRLDGRATGILAAVLVSFFPSIYGNLRHFEPNVPLTALVTFSLWTLSSSHRFSHRGFSGLFGLAAGLTLLVDRISGMFFLAIPALVSLWAGLYGNRRHSAGRRRQVWVNVGLASAICLLLAGYYYYNFFRLYRDEILPQATSGEILSTGEHSEIREPLALSTLLFYPDALLDSQVGIGLSIVLTLAALAALWQGDRRHRLWWLWILAPFVLFTLIQKKQLYYTIPVLPAFALLAAAGLNGRPLRRFSPVLVTGVLLLAFHQHQALSFGQGLLPERVLLPLGSRSLLLDLGPLAGRSVFPPAWVSPRYPQSWPPSRADLKVPEILAAVGEVRGSLPAFRVETFSEDHDFFEGYLTFFIRCAHPLAIVNGLLQNPQGFYENIRLMDAFVYVTPSKRRFPTPQSIQEMLQVRGSLKDAEGLPIVSVLETYGQRLELRQTLSLSNGASAYIYGLKPWRELNPAP